MPAWKTACRFIARDGWEKSIEVPCERTVDPDGREHLHDLPSAWRLVAPSEPIDLSFSFRSRDPLNMTVTERIFVARQFQSRQTGREDIYVEQGVGDDEIKDHACARVERLQRQIVHLEMIIAEAHAALDVARTSICRVVLLNGGGWDAVHRVEDLITRTKAVAEKFPREFREAVSF